MGCGSICGYAAWKALAGNMPYVVFYPRHARPLLQARVSAEAHQEMALLGSVRVPGAARCLSRAVHLDGGERAGRESFWLHRWNPYVVPYGANGPPADPQVLREAFFERCPEVRGKRFLLFLGRIHRKKGCDLLIDAFAKVAQQDPDLYLVMAGPDQQLWSAELQRDGQQVRASRIASTGRAC